MKHVRSNSVKFDIDKKAGKVVDELLSPKSKVIYEIRYVSEVVLHKKCEKNFRKI